MASASNTVYEFNSLMSLHWLEANMFIKVYGLHLLTKLNKYVMRQDNERDKYTLIDRL